VESFEPWDENADDRHRKLLSTEIDDHHFVEPDAL
jgi:hypothetical protein